MTNIGNLSEYCKKRRERRKEGKEPRVKSQDGKNKDEKTERLVFGSIVTMIFLPSSLRSIEKSEKVITKFFFSL